MRRCPRSAVDLTGRRDADRVRQHDVVGRGQPLRELDHHAWVDRPSNGQPNATLIVTVERTPSSRARARTLFAAAAASSTEAFAFLMLKLSVAASAKRTSSRPASRSRS
jgi:hypothetical protein